MLSLRTRMTGWLSPQRAGWMLLAAVAVAYVAAYFAHGLSPGAEAPELRRGWWSWADQFEYYRSATALAAGHPTPENSHYPPGYSLLGALAQPWLGGHLFLLPDLLLMLGAAWAWWIIARSLVSPAVGLLVAAAYVALHWKLIADTQVIPWNTLVTQCTLLSGIALLVTRRGPGVVVGLAGLAAATYLTRPIDAVAFAPLLVGAVLRLPGWGVRAKSALLGGAILAAAVVVLAGYNHAVFGTLRSSYEQVSLQGIGFFSYPVAWKAYWIFIDGRPFFGETTHGLLFRYPWLWLALPGAFWWVRRDGWAAGCALLAVGLNGFLYLNYNDFLPSDIYRYTLIHYLTWSFPLLALLGVAALTSGWRDRWTQIGFGTMALLFLVAFGLHVEEQPLPPPVTTAAGWLVPAERPLVVRFSTLTSDTAPRLRLDGTKLNEYLHYLTPETTNNLQLFLGTRSPGSKLSFTPAVMPVAAPTLATYHWTWRLGMSRLQWFGQYARR